MIPSRRTWVACGLLAGLAGLSTSYLTAALLTVRQAPVVAVAELIIRLTPGDLAERAISAVGHWDKPLLLAGVVAGSVGAFGLAGLAGRWRTWAATLVFTVLAAVGAVAVTVGSPGPATRLLPVLVGYVTWVLGFGWFASVLRAPVSSGAPGAAEGGVSRRSVVLRAGGLGLLAAASAAGGRLWGAGARHVEEARRLVRLEGVTMPKLRGDVQVDLEGVAKWVTPADDFYLIHTAIAVPRIDPAEWRLRIHGLVDRELELTYADLLAHEKTEKWVTICCVSNLVGGDLIGNAWWSGVRISDLLALAGVQDSADAVLQTSADGWTCGTPLVALTDARDAILAIAMNGEALPIDHGFPVRTIVPGLYGYVSACKWVVDLEVTRFDEIAAYWTTKGWAEEGPVKLSSRIDVPRAGDTVEAGPVRVGGVAWAQHVGIERVEVSLDGGPWISAELAHVPSNDTWVQWVATVEVAPGDHQLAVRATDKLHQVQTGEIRDVLPDGATGWHTVDFSAE